MLRLREDQWERIREQFPEEQLPVLIDLYRLVFPHAFAEESVLWPVMRRVLPDGEQAGRVLERFFTLNLNGAGTVWDMGSFNYVGMNGVAGTNAAGAVIIGSEAVLARMSAPTGRSNPGEQYCRSS